MLYWGLMLLRSRLFYCLQLPIHPILEGGDPNAILGVIKVMGVNAASQQTLFIVFGRLPIHPILGGGDQNAMLGTMKISGTNAASQQTLFIVSNSPSIHC